MTVVSRFVRAGVASRIFGRWLLALCLTVATASASGANRYPLVLVHGFIGWGPDEMDGYQYWGGRQGVDDMLHAAGYESHSAAVGPVSSNWDRACELYAYINGGRVDYGEAHAARYGHQRYGRSFPGVVPDWGAPGHHARVHLVGHSQGGQTIRVLSALLARGDAAEREATGAEVHPLFRGGQENRVRSITSLATPHDGTTLALMLANDANYLLTWLLALADYLNARFVHAPAYDFKLDHWGISRVASESDDQYRLRVLDSRLWQQPDVSTWDLQPAGAAALNASYPAVPGVYHFSWGAVDSTRSPIGSGQVPRPAMNPALMAPSLAIGIYSATAAEGPSPLVFDESWWPNDGVVNTRSMAAPTLGSQDAVEVFEGQTFRSGVWYFMGNREGWDHLDMVGLQTRKNYQTFFLALARQLSALPP